MGVVLVIVGGRFDVLRALGLDKQRRIIKAPFQRFLAGERGAELVADAWLCAGPAVTSSGVFAFGRLPTAGLSYLPAKWAITGFAILLVVLPAQADGARKGRVRLTFLLMS